jgi:hypothetical protein
MGFIMNTRTVVEATNTKQVEIGGKWYNLVLVSNLLDGIKSDCIGRDFNFTPLVTYFIENKIAILDGGNLVPSEKFNDFYKKIYLLRWGINP